MQLHEHSADMTRRPDALVSSTGDVLPLPEALGVLSFTYLSFISIPPELRGKGQARREITEAVARFGDGAIYTELVDSDKSWGGVLKPLFERLGFTEVPRDQLPVTPLNPQTRKFVGMFRAAA